MDKILIIGCGFGGITAAIKCAQKGAHVVMAGPMQSERAQSVMAMGGINAALNTKGEDDSVAEHFKDTMSGGCYINNAEAVKRLTADAPGIVTWLEELGVNFDRDEEGRVDLRNFGGQKKKRTAYSGAHSGKQIMTALIAECRKYEVSGQIERLDGWRLLRIIQDAEQVCVGAVLLEVNTQQVKVFTADAVIIATGAPNGVFGKTSGSVVNDGSAAGILLRQGVRFADLEMIQYHPTTLETPNKKMLITEAARGQGGRLYTLRDGQRWYFMEEWFPELGALMPRDVVSRSIYKVCNEMGLGIEGKNQVYLDISFLPGKVIDYALDEVVQTCKRYRDIDPHKEPVPVYPGIHYFMGGIQTDEYHRTNIQCLYAVGECSSQYHGANRLGGNSILGAIHGGIMAAGTCCLGKSDNKSRSSDPACEEALKKEQDKVNHCLKHKQAGTVASGEITDKMSRIMQKSMGIYRDRVGLEAAYKEMERLAKQCDEHIIAESYYDYVAAQAAVLLAQAFLISALERKESRGAHQRLDYPQSDDLNYKNNTVIQWKDARFYVESKEI